MSKEKIKIAFIDTVGLIYDGDSLKRGGMGGSEAAMIYMTRELVKLDFDVTVYNIAYSEGIFDGVKYIHLNNAYKNNIVYDIVISQRSCLPFIPLQHRETIMQQWQGFDIQMTYNVVKDAKFKAVWMHDTFCQGDNWLELCVTERYLDEIFTLSDWHTNYIMNGHTWRGRIFEVLKRHMWQTRNGIVSFTNEVDISKKDPNLFVFNSAVTKGMNSLLLDCWPKIKQYIPDAKIKIIGGYYEGIPKDKNGQIDTQQARWMELKQIYNGKDGIEFTGVITAEEVANILIKASLMIYPAEFPETFGISPLEALNYNTPVVGCRHGALEQILTEETCYLIDYEIKRDNNQVNKFVNMVIKAHYDNYLKYQKANACNALKPWITWDTVALQWKQHLYNKLDLPLEINELIKVRNINRKIVELFGIRFLNKEDIFDSFYPNIKQHHIDIITPVWNAENYIEKCIKSVAAQLYEDYHMYIIDDLSTDNTYEVAKKYIESLPSSLANKFTLIKNQEKKYAVGNQYETIKNFVRGDDTIIMLIDGDDWLVNDPDIFNFINREYIEGAKFTYGSCHSVVDNIDLIAQPYPQKVKENKDYRNCLFAWGMPYTHLRTFSKSIFDLVDESVFFDKNGNYFRCGGDNATFYPLIEKCQPEQIHCIQRILYNYNDKNPLNDYKIHGEEQNKNANYIRETKEKKYISQKEYLENLKINYDKVINKDEKAIEFYKENITNRDIVWIDDINITNFKIRRDWFIEQLKELNINKDIDILDIGAWTGAFINSIYELGYKNINCLEISEKAYEKGKESYPYFNWINDDIEKINNNSIDNLKQYDIIIIFEVLEHLVNPIETLKNIKDKLLKENGFIFFTVPTESYVHIDKNNFEHISVVTIEDLSKLSDKIEITTIKTEDYHWHCGYIRK